MTKPADFSVDAAAGKPFRKFWRSTGFTPAELLLEPEMRQTLAYLAGVPNRGIEYLRVHYMLDLVTAPRFGAYDWSLLDQALDVIVENRLRPFFELMGNPSRLFTDFQDRAEAFHWRDFVVALAQRCIARYGRDEVVQWYFECWNEPDRWWRLGGEVGLNNYYDACSEALKAVDPALRLGGPGTARTLADMFKSFMAHCDTGINLFTGEQGIRLDFISIHEKGIKKHAEDLTPDSVGICRRELMAVDYIRQHHPRFTGLPLINNECDPQIGWNLFHTWHATPYFAGLIAKIVDQHQRLMVDEAGIDYEMLSNDNGFLGVWGHRTHLAYFGARPITAAQADHVTDLAALQARRAEPLPFELVKKPALSVMELLALLGTRRLAAPSATGLDPDGDGIGVLATVLDDTAGDVALLVYHSVDRIWQSGKRRVTVDVDGLVPGDYAVAIFRIAPGEGDPFAVWEKQGAPDLPDAAQLAALRAAQEPVCRTRRLRIGSEERRHRVTLDLALPSVALVVLTHQSDRLPAAPIGLRGAIYPGLDGRENVVLSWQAAAQPGIQLFDVFHAVEATGRFVKLNQTPLLSTVHLRARAQGEKGYFKIRARDLFGRGIASEVLQL